VSKAKKQQLEASYRRGNTQEDDTIGEGMEGEKRASREKGYLPEGRRIGHLKNVNRGEKKFI